MISNPIPVLLAASLLAGAAAAQETAAQNLPVRELTAFKDGHAYVLRSGTVRPDERGRVVLDELPAPILGTFWPAVRGEGCRLRSVTASERLVAIERTALELRQMLAANIGAEIVVRETGDIRYRATILGLPQRPGAEVAAAAGTIGPALPEPADVVLLRTEETRRDTSSERIADAGTRLVRLDRIVDVTFVEEPNGRYVTERLQPQLTLEVAFDGARPDAVPVDLSWVEHGFRWIPSYRVVLGDDGKAHLQLQATLVNDLVDLDGATVHLVVGVPSFVAAGQLDPIALQQAVAATTARMTRGITPQAFSNSIMTQVASNFAAYAPAVETGGAPADDAAGSKEQDLYVFTVDGISLRRGERMVLPILETTVDWKDVFKLDVALEPPQEAWQHFGNQPSELAKLMTAPKVRHEIRLSNPGPAPFTTAPALVLQGERVLAQGTMTYTPPGHGCDLELTTAIDLLVDRDDEETDRKPNAVRWNGSNFMRVDLAGHVRITNRRSETVEIEVRRLLFGKLDGVDDDGAGRQIGTHEDDVAFAATAASWRRWPWLWSWWSVAMNGVGEARWTVTIEPGKEAELRCQWHYFWN